MKDVNRIINECNLSKVRVAKYLGVSRQMLYNYLGFETIDELPNDKKNKLFKLFDITNNEQLKNITPDSKFTEKIEARLNEGLSESLRDNNFSDFKGLNKKEQELLSDVFNLLRDKLTDDSKNDDAYKSIKYLYYYLQTMEQVPELKYILAYFDKYNCFIPSNEYAFNEEKQYAFEGILYSAMMLYSNGQYSRNKVSESHKKFEMDIENKKEEKLSRTEELNTFKIMALQELGYTSITQENSKEVFEKIAEIMSRKF